MNCLSEAFFSTMAEVSAAIVSILATAIVAYVIYLKQKRDSQGTHIVDQKRKLNSLLAQVTKIPIPGVSGALLTQPTKKKKPKEPRGLYKVVKWLAGPDSWHLAHDPRSRINTEKALQATKDILDGLTEMADQVVGRTRIPLEKDSSAFRKWAKEFLTSTRDFAWLWESYGEFGWGKNLMKLLTNLERQNLGLPVMRAEDVRNIFESLVRMRTLVGEILFKEETYQTYKLEVGLKFGRGIGLGFSFMTIFGIIIPLLVLFPPVNWLSWQMDIAPTISTGLAALTSLVGFFAGLSATTFLIWKSVGS